MTRSDLRRYLQTARDAMLWKLDGLSEYDIRRPMVPTGTNLLGLVKHLASIELGYFGETFGRPFDEPTPWDEEMPNSDMFATADESHDDIVALYRRAWAHSDATIDALPLNAIGLVPWWGDNGEVTLHRILVHVISETSRHAGHADIVRELIDGAAGLRADNSNLAPGDRTWWKDYRDRLEAIARQASQLLAQGRMVGDHCARARLDFGESAVPHHRQAALRQRLPLHCRSGPDRQVKILSLPLGARVSGKPPPGELRGVPHLRHGLARGHLDRGIEP
jgi:uncharacterized damage-inducible protein DinB